MSPEKNFLNAVFGAVIFCTMFFTLPAVGSGTDQLDESDREEFNDRIVRASACTKARDFECATKELAKAKEFVNGSRDRTTLQKAAESLELERQFAIRDEAKRKYSGERSTVEANASNAEKELAESRRADVARERQRAEERQSSRDTSAGIYADMQKNMLGNMQQINSNLQPSVDAYAASNRARAAQEEEQKRARAERDEREADRRRDAARERADAQRVAENREADAARAQRDREQKRQDEERRNQEVRDSNERKRAAKAEAAKQKAEAAAAKLAEQKAEKQASEQYLKSVAASTRLVATKCPDGEGKYYATGTRPNIKPRVVDCVDVHYRAYCAGSTQYSSGVAHVFIGMPGCFGDTYEINPKPNCQVEQVRVEVVEARVCAGGGF